MTATRRRGFVVSHTGQLPARVQVREWSGFENAQSLDRMVCLPSLRFARRGEPQQAASTF
jgi:hypothetical protein